MILHACIDGTGAVDLLGEHQPCQLMGHGDAPHAELEGSGLFHLIGQAVGRADDERHIPCPAVCAVGKELGQLVGGDLPAFNAHGHDGSPLAHIGKDGFFTTASEAFFSSIFSSGSSMMRKDAKAARRFWYSATPSAKYFAFSLPTQIRSMFCIAVSSFI